MSDLQCAATLLFVVADREPDGEPDVGALVESLRERRCAAVYGGEASPATRIGAALADGLGLAVHPDPRLHERQEEEQDADAVARVCALLAEIGDEYRGETVAVVAAAPLLQRALPTLAGNVAPLYGRRRSLSAGVAAEMRVDADRWLLTAWNGRRLDETP